MIANRSPLEPSIPLLVCFLSVFCAACEAEVEITEEARCALGGGAWEGDRCGGAEDLCGRVACEGSIDEGCHCPDGMCFDGVACVEKRSADGLPVEVVGDDPCAGLAYDACTATAPELQCQWFYRTEMMCEATGVSDVGCRSRLSRCDAEAGCLNHERCVRECPAGSSCQPFFPPSLKCSGSADEGTLNCFEAGPTPCLGVALCVRSPE